MQRKATLWEAMAKVAAGTCPRSRERDGRSINYAADYVMDTLGTTPSAQSTRIRRHHVAERKDAGGGREGAPPSEPDRKARSSNVDRRAGGDGPRRRRARIGRRPQLFDSQFNRAVAAAETTAGLGLQAVRVSDRAGTRPDAGDGARRRPDQRRRAGVRRTGREYFGPITLTNALAVPGTRSPCGSVSKSVRRWSIGRRIVWASSRNCSLTHPSRSARAR